MNLIQSAMPPMAGRIVMAMLFIIAARNLDPSALGLMGIAHSLLIMFLAPVGQSLGQVLISRDPNETPRSVQLFGVTAARYLLLVGTACVLALVVGIASSLDKWRVSLWLLALISPAIVVATPILQARLLDAGRVATSARASLVGLVVSLSVLCALVDTHAARIELYGLAWLAYHVTYYGIISKFVFREYPASIEANETHVDSSLRSWFGSVLRLAIANSINGPAASLGNILLASGPLGLAALGVFSVGYQIRALVGFVPAATAQYVLKMQKSGDSGRVLGVYAVLSILALVVSMSVIVALYLMEVEVLGEQSSDIYEVALVLVVSLVPVLASLPVQNRMLIARMHREILFGVSVGAIVLLVGAVSFGRISALALAVVHVASFTAQYLALIVSWHRGARIKRRWVDNGT